MRATITRERVTTILNHHTRLTQLRPSRTFRTPSPIINQVRKHLRTMGTASTLAHAHRQVSFRAAFASEAEKRHLNIALSERMPCPYTKGSRLDLSFTSDSVQNSPIVVEVEKAFTPFSCSQVLLVHPVSVSSPSLCLPTRFIIKLADIRFNPRFGTPEEEELDYAWTYEARDAFVEGVRRVRSCEWGNEWEDYIPGGRPYRLGEPEAGDDEDADISLWAREMSHYYSVQATYEKEELAYRAMGSLQGRDIPRFFGTVTLPTGDPEPLLSSVRGVVLEYIDGQTLDHPELKRYVSPEQAKGVAEATLRAMRRIRDSLVAHNDIALRNIMLRRVGPGCAEFDFEHPVIIDFGLSDVFSSDDDDYENMRNSLRLNVSHAKLIFSQAKWRTRSLYLAGYRPNKYIGYARSNDLIDDLQPQLRASYFEEIPVDERKAPREVIDEHGKVHVYEPARWKVRPGVQGNDADVEWHPPRK